MFNKKVLVDQSIYTTTIPKVLPINFDKLNINILENYYYKNKLNLNQFSYLKDYYRLEFDQQIRWLSDFIKDHYGMYYEKRVVPVAHAGIVVEKNQSINSHHHIDEYDLDNSPDLSSIIVCKTGNEKSYVEFEYEYGRKRHHKHLVKLEPKKVIVFNSELRHSFLTNINHEPILCISLKFQLI
tara:strand:+ start:92 stop:640 length:549 start_codon:yes stop_codon:yes gene_type:complete